MLETLAFGDTEIERASEAFSADGKQYTAGSYVVRMRQPFSGWAKTLLERQDYPDLRLYPGGPPKRPYDVTAQTLPMQFGVDVVTVKDTFKANLKTSSEYSFTLNHSVESGGMAATNVYSWKEVGKLWKSQKPVYRDTTTGDFFAAPGNGRKQVKAPRIGIYQSYQSTMDEGWTRWLMDDLESVSLPFMMPMCKRAICAALRCDRNSRSTGAADRPRTSRRQHASRILRRGRLKKGAVALKDFATQGGTLIFFQSRPPSTLRRCSA